MLNVNIDDKFVVFENDNHSGLLIVTKGEDGVYSVLTSGHVPVNTKGLLRVHGSINTAMKVVGSVEVDGDINATVQATGDIKCKGSVLDYSLVKKYANISGFSADIDIISGVIDFNGDIYSDTPGESFITYKSVETEKCSSINFRKNLIIMTTDKVAFLAKGSIHIDTTLNATSIHKDGVGIKCCSDICSSFTVDRDAKVVAVGNYAGIVTCRHTFINDMGSIKAESENIGIINEGRFYPYGDNLNEFTGKDECGVINRGPYADLRVNKDAKFVATGPCALFNDVSTSTEKNENGSYSSGSFAVDKDGEATLNGSLKCSKEMYNSTTMVVNTLKGQLDMINNKPSNHYSVGVVGVLKINDPDNCGMYRENYREYFSGPGKVYCGDELIFDGDPELNLKGPITDVAVFENAYDAPAPGQITIIKDIDENGKDKYKVEISGDVDVFTSDDANEDPLNMILTNMNYAKDDYAENALVDQNHHQMCSLREYANGDNSGRFSLVQEYESGKMCIAISGNVDVDITEGQTKETAERVIAAFGTNVTFVPCLAHPSEFGEEE